MLTPTPSCVRRAYRWDEERRAHLRAELDAYYVRLYGLTRDELRYTLRVDPKDAVGGGDFSGETFRVLKEKAIKQHGDASQSDAAAGGTWRSGMNWKAEG